MTDQAEYKYSISFQTGVILAANALQDAFLVVDGPNCTIFRTSQVQGNHDWHSNLLSCTGLHRVSDTDCTTERAAVGDDRLLRSRLLAVSALDECRLVLLTAMAPVAVTGRQYDQIVRELEDRLEKPVVFIPAGSLVGDWLHGYSWTIKALAEQLELPDGVEPDPDKVAIVGHLMDRNEADQTANLEEIERLLAGLSLELTSCWLSGGRVADLARVGQAGTILSFPYARPAARIMAERTGAGLIECDLPVGLEATCGWLRKIGDRLGREDQAERLIERELAHTVPKLEWILPHSLFDKGMVVFGDPHLASAVSSTAREMGCRVPLRAFWSDASHVEEGEREGPGELIIGSQHNRLQQVLDDLLADGAVDLVVSNSHALVRYANPNDKRVAFMELGFPSYHTHALHDSPYLGFRGALGLVQRMANAMSQAVVYRRIWRL